MLRLANFGSYWRLYMLKMYECLPLIVASWCARILSSVERHPSLGVAYVQVEPFSLLEKMLTNRRFRILLRASVAWTI